MTGVQTCALRSEEHTSELQSHDNLVCRLLLEKNSVAAAPDPERQRRAGGRRPPVPPGPARDNVAPVGVAGPCSAGELLRCVPTSFFLNGRAPPESQPCPAPSRG